MSPRRNARAVEASPRRSSGGKRRALGQHFLRDGAVAARIVELVRPGPADLAIEIGPGRGALTGLLAARARRLVAIELDPVLATALRARYEDDAHVEVITADAVRVDYRALAGEWREPGGRVLVVGNLPYSSGTAILAALLEAGSALARARPVELALMLQREVAERVAAGPGSRDYGALSVLSQLAADVHLAFAVPPGAFAPPPQVESAVLFLRVRAEPPVPVPDARAMRSVVRSAFAQRRKTLANALSGGLGQGVEAVRAALTAAGIDPLRRAETLSLAEFSRVAIAAAPLTPSRPR
jgi:16S rRNA (adenine1518-N6/adenine1519-N6)-dimethyltransferase